MTDPEALHPPPARPKVNRAEVRLAERVDWPEWQAWRDEDRGKEESCVTPFSSLRPHRSSRPAVHADAEG
jgi:hypothetical protein